MEIIDKGVALSVAPIPVKMARVYEAPPVSPAKGNKRVLKELLGVPEVMQEIERHKWFESQKAGRDVGFEWAQEDWLQKYSEQWKQGHR